MPEKKTPFSQPLLSLTPRAAAIGIALRLLHHCCCCGHALASHFDKVTAGLAARLVSDEYHRHRQALIYSATIEKPGIIHAAYTAFHAFSLGNQILALSQCEERGIHTWPARDIPPLEGIAGGLSAKARGR